MIDIQTTFLFMLCLVIAYLIGDISPAILFGKAYGIDIKKKAAVMPARQMHCGYWAKKRRFLHC